jgi:peptide/nickel transport system permease protein
MHLSIHSKPPGFSVDMLSIPLDRKPYKSLSNIYRFSIQLLRLQLKVIKSLAVLYVEYSDEPSLKITKQLDLEAFSGKQSLRRQTRFDQ